MSEKREKIDALVKAEYAEGLYDRCSDADEMNSEPEWSRSHDPFDWCKHVVAWDGTEPRLCALVKGHKGDHIAVQYWVAEGRKEEK